MLSVHNNVGHGAHSVVQWHGICHPTVAHLSRRVWLTSPACSAKPTEKSEGSGSGLRPSNRNDPGPPSSPLPGPSLTDPVQTIYWGGTLPNTRRAILGSLSGVGIALGGNLGGVTSWLLGLDGGELAERTRADVLVPVRGAKRCVDYTYGFEFTYPASWLGDQTLAYRAAKRAEAARGGLPLRSIGADFDDFNELEDANFPRLSPSSASLSMRGGSGGSSSALDGGAALAGTRQQPVVSVAEPVAAFGPPGTTGEENVSIIVAPIAPGFTLQSLGDPQSAGKRFLATLAPEGSGLQAQLLGASGRTTTTSAVTALRRSPTGHQSPEYGDQLYYTLEYTVRGPRFYRHNVSVYAIRNDLLYTFNAQCPEGRWQEDAGVLLASAASLKLF
ncbi:hypothetical protein VaNZ11_005080 [Volvox africanus]|uniref:PsbP C-terminal domain-containing protein n=1 Tax=Volvox africanus TaxID=51714 RepID=A0ABQ5RY60_9CHLO|nr:hypothetical protein VaNZ11_005080 [Volvox africanus]